MTPEARIAAAIEVLDRVAAGTPAEQALTTWARGNRYAGSKDRAGVRDHVFDALRRRSSLAMLGGGEGGRALMIGALRAEGRDPAEMFTGQGYAPPPLTEAETGWRAPPEAEWPRHARLDYPDWLEPELERSLGETLEAVMERLRARAPVVLRVNRGKATRDEARAALAAEGIATEPHALAETALAVTSGARGVRASQAFAAGLVELQDAASQAVVEAIGAPGAGRRALDYCAGGGGKALALAALGWEVSAHDVDPGRMADLPARAARAGAGIAILPTRALSAAGPFDLVLADAPCSGSGAWARQPEARWRLDAARLADLEATQDAVLEAAALLTTPAGQLAYATCSLLACENEDRVEAFLARHPDWRETARRRISPLEGGDGFFLSLLVREADNSPLG